MPLFARLTSRFSGSGSLAWNATSDDSAYPTGRQLYQLSALTYKSSAWKEITVMLEKRLRSGSRHWRNISKALTVCKYILVHGSPAVHQWLTNDIGLIRQLLTTTSFRPEQTKQINEQASQLIELIESPEKRAAEKAAYNRTREQVRTSIGRSSTSRNTLDIVRNLDEIEETPARSSEYGRTSMALSLGAIQEES